MGGDGKKEVGRERGEREKKRVGGERYGVGGGEGEEEREGERDMELEGEREGGKN